MKNKELYDKFYDKVYNPDLKIKFVEENYNIYDSTGTTLLNMFARSRYTEEAFNKDLCTFDFKEIDDVIKSLGYVTENTIQSTLSFFARYTDWCMINKYRGSYEDGMNNFSIFMATQDLSNFIPKSDAAYRYITEKEISFMIYNLVNPLDQAIILGLYEGIAGEELHELRSLKLKNINFDTNEVILFDLNGDKRKKKISNRLKDILKLADKQTEYMPANGTVSSSLILRQLYESPYVIRSVIKHTSDSDGYTKEPMNYYSLLSRIGNIRSWIVGEYDPDIEKTFKFLGYGFITPRSLQDSGAINLAVKIAKERGMKELITEKNEASHRVFKEVAKPENYNLSPVQVTSLKKKYKIANKYKDFWS